ncbi:MAG: MlaD family protein [Candidatus Nitricoxidivorans perseverans]|uniref:MlaD family protein n=1 Tax=Candidatus Nitricoxidivorans perseverans TaxID=2975601 RepID=A0AA49FLP0_9PROT|nr:MAG: MlaD family protein [Candidatus Nitricoxidivorans perseverans]
MENRANALAAGIFVLLMGLAAAAALWWLGQGRDHSSTYVLETRGNVTGLNPQAQVRWRGIRAGKVEDIGTDANDPRVILVRISLDSRYRLTKATTAQLGYQGITGLAYVQLEDDGSSAEPLAGTDAAPPRIALTPSLFDILGDRAAGIAGQAGDVSARLSRLLDDRNLRNLSRTIDNLAVASEGMRDTRKLMADLREAFSEENRGRLSAILAHVEKTAGETAPLTAEAREMVKSMTALSRRFERLADEVERTNGKLNDSTLPRAHALMEEMATTSRRFSCFMKILEDRPQALIFGKGASSPERCSERAP